LVYSEKWSEEVRRAMGNRTQLGVAKKIGVSAGTIQNMLAGKIPTDKAIIRGFAEAIDESPDKWELFAKLCDTEIYLRGNYNMSEMSMREVLDIIEEILYLCIIPSRCVLIFKINPSQIH